MYFMKIHVFSGNVSATDSKIRAKRKDRASPC